MTAENTNGTEDAEKINDWHDLNAVRDELDKDYVLEANLDSETDGYDEHVDSGDGWDPIGNDEDDFTGTFDGNNYQIADLVIDRDGSDIVGLFGGVGGTIENVVLVNSDVTGDQLVGTLVGALTSESTVKDSYATGEVSGSRWIGGLVGGNNPEAAEITITRSGAAVDMNAEIIGGGLIGILGDEDCLVTNCFATGTVGFGGTLGGLCGQIGQAEVTSSFATGDIEGDPDAAGTVGGLIGALGINAVVSDTYATGSITGFDAVQFGGGLIGTHNDDTSLVTRSYATGNVLEGEDTGFENLGGLVGTLGGSLTESYWDTESTDRDEAVGMEIDDPTLDVTGLTTAEMQGSSAEVNMTDLDFDDTWSVLSSPDCYPKLQWEETGEGTFLSAAVENSPIDLDDEAVIHVVAGGTTTLSFESLWTDWVLTTISASDSPGTEPGEGETPDDGTLELSWNQCRRGSVAVTVGVTPNEDVDPDPKYVGGEYLLEVHAGDSDEARMLTIELE